MDKHRLIRVTDSAAIDEILGNLDAPDPVGGTSVDGLLMRAEEYRAWRAEPTSRSEQE